jgi:hypothetical protein
MGSVTSSTTGATKWEHDFDPGEFLATIAKGRTIGAFDTYGLRTLTARGTYELLSTGKWEIVR